MVLKFIDDCNIVQKSLNKNIDLIKSEISVIKNELKKGYYTQYASLNLPEDDGNIDYIVNFSKKYLDYSTIVVIGIGGSNLGTQAIFEAIYSKYSNQKNVKKMYFVDTVDSDSLHNILELVKIDISNRKKVLINVISKSGGTTETIANYELFEKLLLDEKVSLKNHVVITTNNPSKLWSYGIENKIPCLEIPELVGGRYSVFSSVGLFPLCAFGLDIHKLIKGAKYMKQKCLNNTSNPALSSALNIFYAYQKNCNIIESFIFKNDFETVGKWYRQLMGESLGKQFNLQGKEVWNGLTPTVAIGSTDLHSMAQLYLGGPKDKLINFIIPSNKYKIHIDENLKFDLLVKGLQSKSLEEIMSAIIKGIQGALKKQNRLFNTIILESNEEDIGALLQMKMFEIIFLGKLMNVNCFDQPNVEEYKLITKKYLK